MKSLDIDDLDSIEKADQNGVFHQISEEDLSFEVGSQFRTDEYLHPVVNETAKSLKRR